MIDFALPPEPAALGTPDEAAHLASYQAQGGRPPGPAWEHAMVVNLFRLVAILQGNAAAADARATGERARRIADAGCRLAQQFG